MLWGIDPEPLIAVMNETMGYQLGRDILVTCDDGPELRIQETWAAETVTFHVRCDSDPGILG